jgi:signal transduction histidine kinase
LWFASAKGAVAVDLSRLVTNPEPPPVWIEEVRCRNQIVERTTVSEMPASHRDWEFHFTALCLTAPEKVRFRHQLVGYDPNWVESGGDARPGAQYRSLPPGEYRFQVIACNNDGVWNEQGDSFQFSIAPFVWETTWFPVVAATLSLTLLALLARQVMMRRVRRRIALLEQQHAVEKERTRIAQDIHDELGANLTRINLLADLARKSIDRPEQVTSDLIHISNTARETVHAMDAIVWAVNPRNDSVEKFADYISQFAESLLRLANIRCRLDMPPDLPELPLSIEARHNLFLAVKEALNNVVRHAAATEVWIRLGYDSAELRVSVEDNGRGMPPGATAPNSNGLVNIRSRIENLGGQVDVTSEPLRGTRIFIRLPVTPPSGT